ncbi:MAG: hypothetical protein F2557_05385 [Actinobacteria bacterium]|uniref:Unannotated protein n=1 Tax=freshwater metagenome TaxID=449393 RepID=A0A6J6EMK2_9ZZZZ|nr:hypothetical protein [Actinomycetota bacterium]
MKLKALLASAFLITGVFVAPAVASEKPIVTSFTFTPLEVDLLGSNTNVTFNLVVSHPSGIANTNTYVTLKNNLNDTLGTFLTRVEKDPAAKNVTFAGSLTIPRDINTGVYSISVAEVMNNSSAGYSYSTGTISAGTVRTLVGATSGLIIRSDGVLNYNFPTIVGPSYDSFTSKTFLDPIKYNSLKTPIWKVGETFDPASSFELQVPSLPMILTSLSPTVCPVVGKSLNLIKEGLCSFTVSTAKTNDYLATSITQSVTITAARIKPTLVVSKISNQTTSDLPKSISLSPVFSSTEGYIQPTTLTPGVCFASLFFVRILAGGTCTLTYRTAETASFLASDLYTVTFDVSKDGQPLPVPTPVVTPTPTATAKPVIKKTITCIKGTKTVKRTAVSPKCPTGYKVKK